MNILVINGPNLNLLGIREPDIYGASSLEELMTWLETTPEAAGHAFKFFQSNHEGEIIDTMQDERLWANGIIINPGAFAHYSYAIRDAITSINIDTVEVHMSDINKREEFRRNSIFPNYCISQISGMGIDGYVKALSDVCNHSNEE
mgnify:CR=1 FL=1